MDDAQHDNSFLTFRVGPYHLAVPAVDAEAIITMPEIRSVPLTPDSVSGVFSHRGKIAVVISLKRKFGIKESGERSADQLIITQISMGLTAFKVDEVLDIISASELNFSTLPVLGMITAFDRFAVKDDKIILRTDFELLCRIEDSDELADSLKSLTRALKPKPDSDKPLPDENTVISETKSHTILEEKAEQESTIHSDSQDSSPFAGNPIDMGSEKFLKQRLETARKRGLLKFGNRPVRKPIPYKARTAVRKTPTGQRLPTKRQTVHRQPKRYLRFALAGIVILSIISISMIGLWPENHKNEKVAYRSEGPAVDNNQELSTRSLDLPQRLIAMDTSRTITDTADVPEDKNDEIIKTKESADTGGIPLKAVEEIPGTVEKDNTNFTTPQESKEVLRVETDDFTLTIERPRSQKTKPAPQLEQEPVAEDEKSQILQTDKQQPLKTERSQPEKTDKGASMSVTAGKMEIIHMVVKGDTLWDIAAKYLGDPFRYPELAKLSRINDPDLIYPGDLIRITKKKRPVMAKQKGSSAAL